MTRQRKNFPSPSHLRPGQPPVLFKPEPAQAVHSLVCPYCFGTKKGLGGLGRCGNCHGHGYLEPHV